jgi:hypothetical protein
MSDPWDIPPLVQQGDGTPDAIYRAIGEAVCSWEQVEVRLSWLYGMFTLRWQEGDRAFREYGGPGSFTARATKLEAAMEAYRKSHHDQALEGDFTKAISLVRNFSARRNDIAHSVIGAVDRKSLAIYHQPHMQQLYGGGVDFFLFPPHYRAKKFDASNLPTYAYSSREISFFNTEFLRLIVPLDDLYWRLRKKHCP